MPEFPLFHKLLPFNGKIDNPLVLIHGFLESHTMWYQLPLEQFQRPILLLDVPSFGKSELLDDELPSIRHYAQAIAQLLEHYNFNSFQLVGHSMGGYIGLELLKMTEKAEKLILLNSNFWCDSDAKKKDRVRAASILLQHKDAFIAEAIPNLFLNPTTSSKQIHQLVEEAKKGVAEWYAYASLAMKERNDFSEFLKNNPARFEIIHGKQDGLIPFQLLQEKCGAWKTPAIIENSGHMSVFEQPQEVMDLLKKLLN